MRQISTPAQYWDMLPPRNTQTHIHIPACPPPPIANGFLPPRCGTRRLKNLASIILADPASVGEDTTRDQGEELNKQRAGASTTHKLREIPTQNEYLIEASSMDCVCCDMTRLSPTRRGRASIQRA